MCMEVGMLKVDRLRLSLWLVVITITSLILHGGEDVGDVPNLDCLLLNYLGLLDDNGLIAILVILNSLDQLIVIIFVNCGLSCDLFSCLWSISLKPWA